MENAREMTVSRHTDLAVGSVEMSALLDSGEPALKMSDSQPDVSNRQYVCSM